MASLRAALRREPLRGAVAWLAAGYIGLAARSGRWRIESADGAGALLASGAPFIACFWHGRMLMLPHAWRRSRAANGLTTGAMNILVSHHPDGRLIARALARLGVGVIAGSTSRGGPAAFRAVLRALDAGECVGITPDGPRGPRMRAAAGAVQAARLAGVPLLPVSCAAAWRITLSSWDRFMLPLPFSPGVIALGEPIGVPRESDAAAVEAARSLLERKLNEMTQALDARTGHATPEPGPVGAAAAAQGRA